MKNLSRHLALIAFTATLGTPLVLHAAEKTAPAAPTQEQMQARMQTMQTRMQAMQKTESADARMPMMAAQMEDMQAMMGYMSAAGCPMAGGHDNMGMQGQQGMPMMPGMHGSQTK
ncbi:MAG TPA: hypothetical protein DHV85_12455 [Candidatus Accumulibacter sp.]|nr:hypothetical protein [Accumulibacter sp.]HRF10535.1 hypothetical protein [Candidatus Accumulibacter phosphatis]